MYGDLTRWIEDADARAASEAAFEAEDAVGERQYLHLGHAIAQVPSWLHSTFSLDTLASLGSHALDYVRHPASHSRH
ncbi:MAG TPA: hypothetical protein VMB84_11600 [Stellaceae bacterium]|nr:hypothetical protein [Stellaceae bacterium]